ncbi:EndoU domain-containing protein [Frankia sp. ACN1ag]|uniref:EndoU domain-containing protein n=1 Tax=Frankia sp. ACN1ag TaxID=102891 RepID=UPI0006DCBB6A|nr:EndoU domain-containing protein [Frankia sp. ACN1ag]
MAEFDNPRPADEPGGDARAPRPDTRQPAIDAPSPPSDRPTATPREGVERKAALLDRRAAEVPTHDRPTPPVTSAERKAALLEARAAGVDRSTSDESGRPSPGTPRAATDPERKAALLDSRAANRLSRPEAVPDTEERPPSETPQAPSPRDPPSRLPDGPPTRPADTPVRPEISEKVFQHILHGEWNRRGRPVGFHSAPDGHPPPDRRITSMEDRKPDGTYHADVEFRHPTTGEWRRKDVPEHTMFPNQWSEQKVRDAVQTTYERIYDDAIEPRLRNNEELPKKALRDSYDGVLIQLYVSPGGELRTAFPIQKAEPGDPR